MENEPSRLLYPIEHRKWAESIADTKAAQRRDLFNANMRETLSKCRAAKNTALKQFKSDLIKDFGKDSAFTVNFYMKQAKKNIDSKIKQLKIDMRTAREKSVKEYRAEILKDYGY